mmetsp:Transcript_30371/g.73230  ORF Transcript_30371/g.73230 Transcript_30371/m.73230 type:complete len:219 (-) Transcript_30371:71-727(-)
MEKGGVLSDVRAHHGPGQEVCSPNHHVHRVVLHVVDVVVHIVNVVRAGLAVHIRLEHTDEQQARHSSVSEEDGHVECEGALGHRSLWDIADTIIPPLQKGLPLRTLGPRVAQNRLWWHSARPRVRRRASPRRVYIGTPTQPNAWMPRSCVSLKRETLQLWDYRGHFRAYPNGHANFLTPSALAAINEGRQDAVQYEWAWRGWVTSDAGEVKKQWGGAA